MGQLNETARSGGPKVAWQGRSKFPLPAIQHCNPFRPEDWEAIERSIKLGDKFHGVVEFDRLSREGVQLLRLNGWTLYENGLTHYKS